VTKNGRAVQDVAGKKIDKVHRKMCIEIAGIDPVGLPLAFYVF
jgi:hypothetical protein